LKVESSELLKLLHLCDSAFPLGAFAYSDGLETATASGAVVDAASLGAWLEVCLDEAIARSDGPVAFEAWSLARHSRWSDVAALDAEAIALRPSASGRRSTRALGQRLLATWRAIYGGEALDNLQELVARGCVAPSFPVAFASVCATSGIERAQTIEALAYTRLAATVTAAMRLAPIGQREAHALLARTLERVPDVVRALTVRVAAPESFMPAADIAAMSQQYLHSRLFRN
jgi:urease accessory protein